MMMERLLELLFLVIPILARIVLIALGGFLAVWLVRYLRGFAIDRLRYERRFAEECVYEGDSVELVETIVNPTPFFLFYVDVESYFYRGLQIGSVAAEKGEMRHFFSRFHLLPFEKITKRSTITATHRGYYKLTSVSFFRCGEQKYVDSFAELYVYPKLEELREPLLGAYRLGDALSRRKLIFDPFSVSGIREYSAGDPFRSINFKASARTSVGAIPRFMVNQYEYSSNCKYYIYQNFHLPKSSGISFDRYEDVMEEGLRFAASFLVRALDMGGTCAFSANCGTVDGQKKVIYPLRGGEHHKRELLRTMACMRAIDGVSFASILSADILRGISHSEVFILTTYVDSAIAEQISLLERFGNTVKVIMLGGDEK